MSGFGTLKHQTTALNLGFPSAYQSAYAKSGRGESYMATAPHAPMEFLTGDSFQGGVHSVRKAEADRMAMAKVHSTLQMNKRAMLGNAGYFGLAPTNLTQRRPANPSNGAFILNSARQDHSSAPFHYAETGLSGGVLRSAEGQAYGKELLMSRINQLDAINAAKSAFQTTGVPTSSASMAAKATASQMAQAATTTAVAESGNIELNLAFQAIEDSIDVGIDEGGMGMESVDVGTLTSSEEERAIGNVGELGKGSFATTQRLLMLLFRLAPTWDGREGRELLDEYFGRTDRIVQNLNGLLDPDMLDRFGDSPRVATKVQVAQTLQTLFSRLREYLKGMINGFDRGLSPKERLALSKNLVKSLQFAKMMKYTGATQQSLVPEEQQEREFLGQQQFIFSRINRREDSENPYSASRSGFDADERQEFGTESGSYFPTGGRDSGTYFGESEIQDDDRATGNTDYPTEEEIREALAAQQRGQRQFADPYTRALARRTARQTGVMPSPIGSVAGFGKKGKKQGTMVSHYDPETQTHSVRFV